MVSQFEVYWVDLNPTIGAEMQKIRPCVIVSPKELNDHFSKVLPIWDQDHVQNSHIKKLIQWYDILVKAGITDFEEEMAPTEGDNIDDR